jgi:response regulator RpfG family c-di-GMP phosphodiesterase
MPDQNNISGFIATKSNNEFTLSDATGEYLPGISKNIFDILPTYELELVYLVLKDKKKAYFSNIFINYIISQYGTETLIFIKYSKEINDLDRNLINIFSTNISMALDNIQLNVEIEKTQKEIIFTLGEVSEARSKETGNHVKRVSEYTKILALKYGFPEETAEKIRMATPLHDLGKLAIPDIILNKPGKLTPEEFEIMKTHSKIGYDMLKNSGRDIIQIASIIALQHHEKFDGTGYPENLKGNQIHIYGRIVAIADVFDALGTVRVYKNAWPLSEILDLFKQERGKHFDPELVDLFFQSIDEFINIKNTFPDYRKTKDLIV